MGEGGKVRETWNYYSGHFQKLSLTYKTTNGRDLPMLMRLIMVRFLHGLGKAKGAFLDVVLRMFGAGGMTV